MIPSLSCAGGENGRVHIWRLDMAGFAVWPVSFVRKVHELEYCPLGDQGILANATVGDDGWLCGSKGEAMCRKPPDYWPGLLQRAVRVLGAPDTALDMREFVWNGSGVQLTISTWASQSHQMLQILLS